METFDYRIPYRSRTDKFHLIPLGDFHLGSRHCAEEKLQRQVDWIKSRKDVYWIGMGDYAECIVPSDPRFDDRSLAPWALAHLSDIAPEQYRRVYKLLYPIRKRCIGLLRGNHDEKIRLRHYVDLQLELCKKLEVPDLGYMASGHLKFRRRTASGDGKETQEFLLTAHHGWFSGRTKGSLVNNLERALGMWDCDILVVAHAHQKAVTQQNPTSINHAKPPEVVDRKRVAGLTGSFFRTYTRGPSSYGEKKAYPPTALGVVDIVITPDKRDLHISL